MKCPDFDQGLQPISFASRKLNDSELKHTVTNKEALAILWSVKYFKNYAYGHHVTIFTDHKLLANLKSNREPEETLGQLLIKLEYLDLNNRYIRSAENKVADTPKRTPSASNTSTLPNNNNNKTVSSSSSNKPSALVSHCPAR